MTWEECKCKCHQSGIMHMDISIEEYQALEEDYRNSGIIFFVRDNENRLYYIYRNGKQYGGSFKEEYNAGKQNKDDFSEGEIFNDYENNVASGAYSHAEGYSTTALGKRSHAEGSNTNAFGQDSHAEGAYTTASGYQAHAEGLSCESSGDESHSEGNGCVASGGQSHAEGYYTNAIGDHSFAGGRNSTATAICSFAHGDHVSAQGVNSTVFGKYNSPNATDLFQIGNGTAETASNALAVDTSGNTTIAGQYIDKTGEKLVPLVPINESELDVTKEEWIENNAKEGVFYAFYEDDSN